MMVNDTVVFQFHRVERDEQVNSQSQYSVSLPAGVTWHEVLRHFATFLDQCGYVGVSEGVDNMLAMDGNSKEAW